MGDGRDKDPTPTPPNPWLVGAAGAGGREAAVQMQLGQAYDAGLNAPHVDFSGDVYRSVPTNYWDTFLDWTKGGSLPGGEAGRYSATGDPVVYTSPTQALNVGEMSAYGGMADRSLIRSGFDAPLDPLIGAQGIADVAGNLPFSANALTAPKGNGEAPWLYRLTGENPYSMPQQVGAGATDSGAFAMQVPSATGGTQIDIIPRTTDPTQILPLGRTDFDASGAPMGPEIDITGLPSPMPTTGPGETGFRDMPAGQGGRAGAAGYGALGGGAVALGTDLYRAFNGQDVSAGQMLGDTALGAGTGALGGVAQQTLENSLVPMLGSRALSSVAGGSLVGGATSGLFSTWNNADAYKNGQETASQATANVLVDTGIGLGAGASGAALGAAIGSIVPGAGTAIGAGVGFLAGTLGSMAVNALADGSGFRQWADKEVGGLITGLGAEDTLKNAWNGISTVTTGIGNVANGIGQGVSNVANGIGTGIGNVVSGIGEGAGNLVHGVGDVLGNIGGGIASFFGLGGGG